MTSINEIQTGHTGHNLVGQKVRAAGSTDLSKTTPSGHENSRVPQSPHLWILVWYHKTTSHKYRKDPMTCCFWMLLYRP